MNYKDVASIDPEYAKNLQVGIVVILAPPSSVSMATLNPQTVTFCSVDNLMCGE